MVQRRRTNRTASHLSDRANLPPLLSFRVTGTAAVFLRHPPRRPSRVCHPNARTHVRLIGPCYKTGRLKPFRQHLRHTCRTGECPLLKHHLKQHAVVRWGRKSSPSDMTAIVACDARFALASVQAPQWDSAGCNSRTTQMNWRALTFPPAVYCGDCRTHADQTPATGTPGAGSSRDAAEIRRRDTPPRPPTLSPCPHWFQAVSYQQFQALFYSLFKGISILPSRYLLAIGLFPKSCLRRNLAPTLSCTPKQLDSSAKHRTPQTPRHRRDCHPL